MENNMLNKNENSKLLNQYVRGTVKFYNEEKGYGFITVNGQDVFFHVSKLNIKEEDIVLALKNRKEWGEMKVYCKVVEGKKGLEAVEICEKSSYEGRFDVNIILKNKEGGIAYFLADVDGVLERRELQTFCDGKYYALKNEKFIQKGMVSTTDVAALFEKEEIDQLYTFGGVTELRIKKIANGYTMALNEDELVRVAQWQNIKVEEEELNQFIKAEHAEIYNRSRVVIINETKTKVVLKITTYVKYNERLTYNVSCRMSYYGSVYEDMFSKSASQEEMYPTECDYKTFESTYEFALNNGISELIEQILF